MRYNNIMNLRLITANLFLTTFFSFLVFAPVLSLAQIDVNPQPPNQAPITGIKNPIPNITSLTGLLKTILTAVIKIGIPLVVLAIIYSGFLFVTAVGNAEKLSKAKDALVWSLVGAGVLLGSWAIAELITATVSQLSG